MFAEPIISPSSNSNTKKENKRVSTNGYYNQERQQSLDYRGTDYNLGYVLQQKPGMPKTNRNSYTNEGNKESHIIQRKIGFEFQTDCHVYKRSENGQKLCLPKNTKLWNTPHVDAKTDEHTAEYSDLEFITKPLNSDMDIETAFLEMHHMWEYLQIKFVNKQTKLEGCNLEMGIDPDDLSATPQVTFGTSLVTISEIADAANLVNSKYNIKNDLLKTIKDPYDNSQFEGLVELIKCYIRSAQRDMEFDYPKQIADPFLLSRTDFGSLFNLSTSDNYKKSGWFDKFRYASTIIINKQDWLINFNEFDLDEPLIQKVKISKETKMPTIREWLVSIYDKSVDLITKFKEEDRESMGSMGLDKVYNYKKKANEKVGVFELRANHGARCFINKRPSWGDFMRYWYKAIEETGYLPPSKLPAKEAILTKLERLPSPIPH